MRPPSLLRMRQVSIASAQISRVLESGKSNLHMTVPPDAVEPHFLSYCNEGFAIVIHRLIELSLRNRGLVIALYLGLAAWGYWALLRTPIDAIPDLSDNQIIVFTDWLGRS